MANLQFTILFKGEKILHHPMQKHIKETYMMCQRHRCGKGIFQNLNLPGCYCTRQI